MQQQAASKQASKETTRSVKFFMPFYCDSINLVRETEIKSHVPRWQSQRKLKNGSRVTKLVPHFFLSFLEKPSQAQEKEEHKNEIHTNEH